MNCRGGIPVGGITELVRPFQHWCIVCISAAPASAFATAAVAMVLLNVLLLLLLLVVLLI